MLISLTLALPAVAIRYYLRHPVSKLYSIIGIAIGWVTLMWVQFNIDPHADSGFISLAAVLSYFALTWGNNILTWFGNESALSSLPTLSFQVILNNKWTYQEGNVEQYSNMEWQCSHTGEKYQFGRSMVFLSGPNESFLVRPPDHEAFSVVRIDGVFRKKLYTEMQGPTKEELQSNTDMLVDANVIPPGATVP